MELEELDNPAQKCDGKLIRPSQSNSEAQNNGE